MNRSIITVFRASPAISPRPSLTFSSIFPCSRARSFYLHSRVAPADLHRSSISSVAVPVPGACGRHGYGPKSARVEHRIADTADNDGRQSSASSRRVGIGVALILRSWSGSRSTTRCAGQRRDFASYLGSSMAGAFLAIGYASQRTRNQVIAFILTVVVCFLFLLAGFPLS